MKLLLICVDGVRVDLALPEFVQRDDRFRAPDHPSDPRFSTGGADQTACPDGPGLAPTLRRLASGDDVSEGVCLPMWMTPPTDSGPGWASILTGSTHEQCNVWWNEFVGHDLARRPDLLSRVFFANPAARTIAAATWNAFVAAPGPILQQRVDQQRTGQHKVFHPDLGQGIEAADDAVCAWAAWHLLHEGPDAAVVYFEGVDAAGHAFGGSSSEYAAAIRAADERVRHLVKAVSERHEQLGEDWLIAVTTDHGHKPEGGHGDDEVEVRRSFLVLHRVGGALPGCVDAGRVLHSEDVLWLLLEAIGARQGDMPGEGVGVLRDIEPLGPTRNLTFEW